MKMTDIHMLRRKLDEADAPMREKVAIILDKDDCSELLLEILDTVPLLLNREGMTTDIIYDYYNGALASGIAYRKIHGMEISGVKILSGDLL